MKHLHIFRTIFFAIVIIFSTDSLTYAQCEGVYFKPISKRIFPSGIYFPERDSSRYKDLNGDGKIDFVGTGTEENNFQTRKIYIFTGDGNGRLDAFSEITLSNLINYGNGVSIVDFNFDGKNDLLIRLNTNPSTIVVYKNDGTGTFTPLLSSVFSSYDLVKTADINGDNILDLIIKGALYYYKLGRTDGTFAEEIRLPPTTNAATGDFNNDGKLDFPVLENTFSYFSPLQIYFNQGNGEFVLSPPLLTLNNYYSSGTLQVNDFNNDGKPDLIASGFYYYVVLINQGNNNFIADYYPNFDSFPYLPSFGDFNGDGFPDFIDFAVGRYIIFTNNGLGKFTPREYSVNVKGSPIGDVDSDGKTDLIQVNNFNENNTIAGVRIFNETQIVLHKNICSRYGQTKIVDFDRDGKTNFTFWRENAGLWHYKDSSFHDVFFKWGTQGDIPVPGDYDGDSQTDFAVYRPSDGVWYIRRSSDGSYLFQQFGLSSDKPVASDYDGDEKTDIAVYRPSEGNWYGLLSETQQFFAAHFGISEDKPVPEDYDGDGKTDLAVFRPSSSYWFILNSSDLGFSAIKWGISSDIPTPADFDGDGKADLTVFRAAEGNWYILRSFNSQFRSFQFGLPGDIPQVGDWDGNGIMDIGVYRPSLKSWYSSDKIIGVQFGSEGEMPISYILRTQ